MWGISPRLTFHTLPMYKQQCANYFAFLDDVDDNIMFRNVSVVNDSQHSRFWRKIKEVFNGWARLRINNDLDLDKRGTQSVSASTGKRLAKSLAMRWYIKGGEGGRWYAQINIAHCKARVGPPTCVSRERETKESALVARWYPVKSWRSCPFWSELQLEATAKI